MVVQLYAVPQKIKNELPQRFERKYYVTPGQMDFSLSLLRQSLRPAAEFPAEQINSLYFDTAGLDQYQRSESGDFKKDKVRIRWYGSEENLEGMQTVFVELKSRRAFASTKQRLKLMVPAESLALANLSKGIVPAGLLMDTLARFGYFPFEPLLPVIRIAYWRWRFEEMMTGQRVTLDSRIRSTPIMPGLGRGEKDLELPGGVIEIKGQAMEMPRLLCQTRLLDTDWTRFSKYSACIDAHCENTGAIGRLSPSGRIIRL